MRAWGFGWGAGIGVMLALLALTLADPTPLASASSRATLGAWLVLNLGWSRFFFQGPDFAKDPYINAWNHPGITPAAVDKLIEIMDDKGVKIAGIVADNIAIDSGQSSKGEDDQWTNAFYAHVRLLQRNLLFVENAANLDLLATVRNPKDCLLSVGAPKHVRGTGGPSRVMAICNG